MVVNDLFTDEDRAAFNHVIHSHFGPVPQEEWDATPVRPGDEVILTNRIQEPAGLLIGLGLLYGLYAGMTAVATRQAKKAIKQTGGSSDTFNDSPTYSWDGIETIADVGVPVAVIYGDKNMVGGNIISMRTSTQDDSNVLHMLLGIGEGPLKSIAGLDSDQDAVDATTLGDSILINGNPISNYKHAKISVRLGNEVQTIIPGFESLHEQFSLTSSEIILRYGAPADTGYVYTTTGNDLNAAIVHIEMPDGLWRFNAGGSQKPRGWSVQFRIEYRVHGSGSGYTLYDNFTIGPERIQTALRRNFRVEFPSADQYDIRLTRLTHDPSETPTNDDSWTGTLQVVAVDEIVNEGLSCPFTALLAVDILATEQISGRFPNMNIEVEGLIISDWSGGGATCSNNPVVQRYDFLTNERYGVGRHHVNTLFDNTELQASADYCDVVVDAIDGGTEPRFESHVVMDGSSTLLDFLLEWDKAFRGKTYYSGNALMVTVDRPGVITQNFGDGALKKDTTVIQFNSRKTILTTVEVQFQNEENSYMREPALVEHSAVLESGLEPDRELTLLIPAIKSAGQAVRIARYLLLRSRLSTITLKMTSALNAVSCQAHQIVGIAHHTPSWGLRSGRIKSGTASTFQIYEKVTLPTPGTGETLVVTIQHKDDSIETEEITSAPGEYIGGANISISPATFTSTPEDYDTYSIGMQNLEHKPFRVEEIRRKNDGEVTMNLLEYDDEIYNEADILADILDHNQIYTNLPNPASTPDSVANLTAATERSYETPIMLSWSPPLDDSDFGFWDHAEIYVAEVDDELDMDEERNYDYLGETKTNRFLVRGLEPGVTWRFRVVSVSRWRIRELFSSATSVDATPTIPIYPPPATGLELVVDRVGQGNSQEFAGSTAEFRWRMPTLSTGFQLVGDEPYGVGQGTVEPWFEEFWVNIWDHDPETSEGTIIRQTFQREPFFRYTPEMNAADHGGSVDRIFALSVRVKDRFLQLSPHTDLSVWNPIPPAIITHHATEPVATRWHTAMQFYVWDTNKVWAFWNDSTDLDIWGYRVWREENVTTAFSKEPNGQPLSALLWQNTMHSGLIDVVPTGGNTVAYMLAAVDLLGRYRFDELLNFAGHFYIDSSFDGTKDAAGLWNGVTFVPVI